jgi:hypothetical protein
MINRSVPLDPRELRNAFGSVGTGVTVVTARHSNAMFVEGINTILKICESDPPYNIEGKFWNVSVEKTMIPEIGQGFMMKPFQRSRPLIVGTAVARYSPRARGDLGQLHYACQDWMDTVLGKRSMELFATEVMPRVNAATAQR